MSYDLIIIGAGTAGCILAKRYPGQSMIILERGTDQHTNPIIYNPANGAKAAQPPYSEIIPTDTPQAKVSVARLYGGASSHNYGLVVHGSKDFYQKNWLDLNLSYEDYLRIFQKVERYTGNSENPDQRGWSGELVVSQLPQKINLLSQTWSFLNRESILDAPKTLNVLTNLGPLAAKDPFAKILTDAFDLPVVEDYNTGIGDCVCQTPQVFVDPITGLRSSVDVTYLKDLRDHVVAGAEVDRIWKNGVSWRDHNGDYQFTPINPKGKIILSAGAIHTPRILQRSGFPEAGKGLMQHYGFSVTVGISGVEDFSSGPLAFANGRKWQIVTSLRDGKLTFLFWLLDPKARGKITPYQIKLNLFPPEDLVELEEGAKYIYRVILKLRERYSDLIFLDPSEEKFFEDFPKRLSLTDHYSGTCRLGQLVDPSDFHLKGYPNLHVVDTSLFPQLPDGNTEFPVAVMAEIAAERIFQL